MNTISLQRAIHGFALAKEAEGKSLKTTQWYRHFLLKFDQYLAKAAANSQLNAITAEQVREFLKYLREPHPPFGNTVFDGKSFKQPVLREQCRGPSPHSRFSSIGVLQKG